MITEKLKMDHRKTEEECAHRTGKPTTGPGNRPRPIVFKFLRFKDMLAVLAYICYDRLIVYPPSQKPGRNERAKPMGL
jgi:hypothetical protein